MKNQYRILFVNLSLIFDRLQQTEFSHPSPSYFGTSRRRSIFISCPKLPPKALSNLAGLCKPVIETDVLSCLDFVISWTHIFGRWRMGEYANSVYFSTALFQAATLLLFSSFFAVSNLAGLSNLERRSDFADLDLSKSWCFFIFPVHRLPVNLGKFSSDCTSGRWTDLMHEMPIEHTC